MEKTNCPLCKVETNQKGMGKWRDDIQAYEWYQSDHKCPMIEEAAKSLGALGGKMTKMLHGKEHYSKAGKKGMASRWNK